MQGVGGAADRALLQALALPAAERVVALLPRRVAEVLPDGGTPAGCLVVTSRGLSPATILPLSLHLSRALTTCSHFPAPFPCSFHPFFIP